MEMYIIDVGLMKPNLNEHDTLIAEHVIINRNLLRGYTLNRVTIIKYSNYLESLLGKYVDFVILSYDVPDKLDKSEYDKLAFKYRSSSFSSDCLSAATCTLISSYGLDNNIGTLICNEDIIEYLTGTDYCWDFNNIWYYILPLFDRINNYVPMMNINESIIGLRQFILEGIPNRLKDFYIQDDGKYRFDVYAIIKFFMDKKLFLGVKEE